MSQPKGNITIQTVAMPADTNANGDIFGGWLLSQMDLASGVLAKQVSQGRIATVAIHSMSFLRPVKVGDLVSCHASLIKTGRTSMTIEVEAWVNSHLSEQKLQVTKGIFVCVAIDEQGKPRAIQQIE